MTDQPFDIVFVGGRAFTAGWPESRPLGVGVRDGRIAAVESDAVLRAAGARDVVDLRGGLVLPAFHDAHAHPVQGGLERLQCDLSEANDAADCLRIIAEYAAAHPDEEWILGGGWTMAHFPSGLPRGADLDRIVPDRPVMLSNRDHHGVWVNAAALHSAGIDAQTPDPADGRIERDADGSPSGVLHEGAARLLDHVLPEPDPRDALRGLERAQQEMFALGVVGWQDAWVGEMAGTGDLLPVYLEAVDRGILRARVTTALWWQRDRGLEQLADLRDRRAQVAARGRDDILIGDTVKIMVDGVAENFTAAMSRPYLDACGHVTENRGLTFVDPSALKEFVTALDAEGCSVHFHALGDRAVTVALDAVAAARAANGHRADARHQLAHLQVVRAEDVPRFAELGAAANLQMLWAAVDGALDELTFPFLDPSLIARHYPFRDLRDAGAELGAGSDWPVSSADPIEAIHVAVRRAAPGQTADPRIDVAQSLDLADALAAYTAGSARLNGRDASSGALAVGHLADLVALDTDPFARASSRIHECRVASTWLGGERVYSAESS